MFAEQVMNVLANLVTISGLIISMSMYVDKPNRSWVYCVCYILGTMFSNYYWCVYLLLMQDYPTISSFMAYLGWNVSLIFLFLLILENISGEKREPYFSPLSLIPIPLNIFQFILYIPFGGIGNNVWQGVWCTLIACLSLNKILYYLHYRKKGAAKPYVALVSLLYIICEYVMWTSSCYDWPSFWRNPYIYAVFISNISVILIPLAIYKEMALQREPRDYGTGRYVNVIRPVYTVLIILACVGGYLLAAWIKGILDQVNYSEGVDPYRIITIMLFFISLVITVLTLAIILVVSYGKKAAESVTLREAKKEAENSNAAKSDFLANMSHEIRTPINAVLGMNEMILRESLGARESLKGKGEAALDREEMRGTFTNIVNYSGNIDSAGQSLLSIINDILDFSKIEAGKLELVEMNYALSSVLNDVTNMISFKARDKGLDFQVSVEDSLPNGLYGDELRVRQVMINILNNAVKYTKKGSVRLSIKGEMEGDRVDLVVAVKDTGIGIKKEDIGRLFTKFERMDLKQNSSVEGTGLGLAITQNLISKMGGSIQVESEFGKGSTFTLRIPQKVVSADPVGNFKEKFEKSMESVKAYEESFQAPQAHILIVDDTQMNLTVAIGLLKKTKLKIDTALSGSKAIAMTRDTAYDIILMDQRMPEMDGTEAMGHIREQEDGKNRHTPFICLTADAVSGARERYLAEGFEDYLTKPINSKALEKMLIHYLPKEKVILGEALHEKLQEELQEELQEKLLKKESHGPEAQEKEDSTIGTTSKASQEAPEGNPSYAPLREAGIEPEKGLQYCMQDEGLYQNVLKDYVEGAKERIPQLRKFYGDKDWKNYGIQMHALKSSSKMIGAGELSQLARCLEEAAGEENLSLIEERHEQVLGWYKKLAEAIAPLTTSLGEGQVEENPSQEIPEGESPEEEEEDEILEFLPEEE